MQPSHTITYNPPPPTIPTYNTPQHVPHTVTSAPTQIPPTHQQQPHNSPSATSTYYFHATPPQQYLPHDGQPPTTNYHRSHAATYTTSTPAHGSATTAALTTGPFSGTHRRIRQHARNRRLRQPGSRAFATAYKTPQKPQKPLAPSSQTTQPIHQLPQIIQISIPAPRTQTHPTGAPEQQPFFPKIPKIPTRISAQHATSIPAPSKPPPLPAGQSFYSLPPDFSDSNFSEWP